MGYLRGTMCYDTWEQWQDATFGAIPPTYNPASTTYETFFKKDASAGWQFCRAQLSSTAVRSGLSCGAVPVSSSGVATCDPAGAFVDGAAVGMLVLGVLLVAWWAAVIRRQLL